MSKSKNENFNPKGYVKVAGSERRPSKDAKLLGLAEEGQTFCVTIALRRRTDGPPLPGMDYFVRTPWNRRKRHSVAEFVGKFGAHPDDVAKVVKFAEASGLKVIETHLARRTVVASGTVAQMSRAFAVNLGNYQRTVEHRSGGRIRAIEETYRGCEGFVSVPVELEGIVVGVLGLDNRRVSYPCGGFNPPNTVNVTPQQLAGLYGFPNHSAAGQTIGIISAAVFNGGYFQTDLDSYFNATLGFVPDVTAISCYPPIPGVPDSQANGSIEAITQTLAKAGTSVLTFLPTSGVSGLLVGSEVFAEATPTLVVAAPFVLTVAAVTQTTVTLSQPLVNDLTSDTRIYFNKTEETTFDICIAGVAAPGANIAVYFSEGGEAGWAASISKAVFPDAGYPRCSVLSSSYYSSPGDDLDSLIDSGFSVNGVNLLTGIFQDAAILGDTTILFGSGDYGTSSNIADGQAHIAYPPSDPWVLAVGGTVVGNIGANGNPSYFEEWVWNQNDPTATPEPQWGATGGGVSDSFPVPSYQSSLRQASVNNPAHFGRAIPDVAANASGYSGYAGLIMGGLPNYVAGGTSSATPLWAGLIAVINAILDANVGFINPFIYEFGSIVCRDINPPSDGSGGPTTNGNGTSPGYTAGPRWDACTGWGSPNGVALLDAISPDLEVYVFGGYQSPDIIIIDHTTGEPVPLGGSPGAPANNDTVLAPNTKYGLAAHVHNDSSKAVENVEVGFWATPGSLGTSYTVLGTPKIVSVPAYSYVTVACSVPFTSPPKGDLVWALAVTLYSPNTGCKFVPKSPLPQPGQANTHSCTAWRNILGMPRALFQFPP